MGDVLLAWVREATRACGSLRASAMRRRWTIAHMDCCGLVQPDNNPQPRVGRLRREQHTAKFTGRRKCLTRSFGETMVADTKDFGEASIRVEIYASDETVEIFVEADFEIHAEERRRFAILNIPRNLFSEASGAAARRSSTSSLKNRVHR
jgi:hypothetical protein